MRIISVFGLRKTKIIDIVMNNDNKTYNPFPELPNVTSEYPNSVYFIKTDDGTQIKLTFDEGGKLSESSLTIKASTNEETRKTIEVLERKINEMEFVGVEDSEEEAREDEDNDPFDPATISIEKKTISMDTIIRRLGQETFILNPDFQRKEVWDEDRKCKLIESLLLRIPIPMFYVSADSSDNWTVVDGLQRLSTIRDFVLGSKYLVSKKEEDKGDGFSLKGLDFCGRQLNGRTMKNLPTVFFNRIMETELTFTIINPGTPEDVKRNIFKRINTGGKMLSPQEIRNALYGGISSKLLNKLADLRIFKEATCWSVKDERMEDKELILRFVSFLIRDYSKYSKAQNIDDWLCDTMIILNNRENFETRDIKKLVREKRVNLSDITVLTDEDITSRFVLAMERGKEIFGGHAFRKSLDPYRKTPINKALFETWGILLSKLTKEDYDNLRTNKESLLKDYRNYLWNGQFIIAISRDSMNKNSVNYRYTELQNLINKYI